MYTQFVAHLNLAAVSCSSDAYRLGGVKIGLGLMGKLGRAWVGAWVGTWLYGWVHGFDVVVMCVVLVSESLFRPANGVRSTRSLVKNTQHTILLLSCLTDPGWGFKLRMLSGPSIWQ